MALRALLLTFLLATATLAVLAPAAEARPYCTFEHQGCPGVLCVWSQGRWNCVPPPDSFPVPCGDLHCLDPFLP